MQRVTFGCLLPRQELALPQLCSKVRRQWHTPVQDPKIGREKGTSGAARWRLGPAVHRRSKPMSSVTTSGVVDAILEVGRQRKAVLDQLRAALQSGDTYKALGLARQLCGIHESNRTDSRIN